MFWRRAVFQERILIFLEYLRPRLRHFHDIRTLACSERLWSRLSRDSRSRHLWTSHTRKYSPAILRFSSHHTWLWNWSPHDSEIPSFFSFCCRRWLALSAGHTLSWAALLSWWDLSFSGSKSLSATTCPWWTSTTLDFRWWAYFNLINYYKFKDCLTNKTRRTTGRRILFARLTDWSKDSGYDRHTL